MSEEKNRNMELNTEDLDAVLGGKTYYSPEKTERSVQVTCEDDMYDPAFNHYIGPCAVVTSSLGITFGAPYKYFIKIRNKEYEIVQVVPSIPKYSTCNVILGKGNSHFVRTESATLVQLDYSKMTAYEF